MKVLILMPSSEEKGGADFMFLHFMKRCKNKKIKLQVIFLEEGPIVKKIKKIGIKTKVINAGRLRNALKFILTIRKIKNIAEKEKIDLIFSWMDKAHFYGGIVSLFSRIPSAWYQHRTASKDTMNRLLTLLPAKYIVTCSKTVGIAQSKFWPKRKTEVVYPPVELERFNISKLTSPSQIRKKIGLPAKGPIIGIVGRLQKWKGIHTLIQAMPNILKKHPDAHCIIVGGKHNQELKYLEYLKKIIDELKLKDKVRLAGFQKNIPEWMQAMDVVVHASDNEPFGIVIIEAMALGKPVIAGAKGGPTEIVTEGVDGLFAPYGNSKFLAKQILRYLDNPKFAKKIGNAAKKRAKRFSMQRCIKKLNHTLTK